MLGLKVKLIDVNRFTGCMSITALEKYLDSGGPCHAVVYVDHNGYTARRDDVIELCRSRSPRIPVVEDAAVALGVGDAGKRGDFSILSFSVPKIVTCGQGGAVFTDNPQYLNRLQEIIDQGGGDWRKTRVHQAVGGNFRMPDLTAALGRAQLADLDTLLGMRRRIWSWYEQDLPVFGPADDVGLNGWMVTWRAVDENHANRVIASCEMSGFEAKRLYVPVHRNKSYAGVVTDESDYEEAVAYWERTVYLPSSLTLTREQVRCICAAVNSA
jgi:dTDP-4-amino-4,6-dideoxygalactose transaminase